MKIEAFTLVFEDYVADEYGEWSQICDVHLTKIKDHNSKDVDSYIRLREGTGLCGVEGCVNLAEHYVDF